jgi:glycosyltransferase involved in cell wall biosynthesis
LNSDLYNQPFLLIHNFYKQSGGEQIVFENQVRGFQQFNHKVVIYSRNNSEIDEYDLSKKISLFFSAYSSKKTIKEIYSIIDKYHIKVAIIQNVFPLISPSVYKALKSRGVIIVQAVYNYRFICPSAELYTQGKICERCVNGNYLNAIIHQCYQESHLISAWYATIIGVNRFLKRFSKDIDIFMVPDNFLGKKLIKGGIPPKKIFKNPNPFFIPEPKPNTFHSNYVLFVGRLIKQKGILTLIEAMKKTKTNLKLRIIGNGDLYNEINQLIHTERLINKISLERPLWGPELDSIIVNSAAVIIPSEWYDNLPQILCQSNGLGKPVIASRINGIPEYVIEGNNGYLFTPGDSDELAICIDRLGFMLEKEYIDLSNNSWKYAKSVFDYPIHYKNLMNQIDNILRQKNDY